MTKKEPKKPPADVDVSKRRTWPGAAGNTSPQRPAPKEQKDQDKKQ